MFLQEIAERFLTDLVFGRGVGIDSFLLLVPAIGVLRHMCLGIIAQLITLCSMTNRARLKLRDIAIGVLVVFGWGKEGEEVGSRLRFLHGFDDLSSRSGLAGRVTPSCSGSWCFRLSTIGNSNQSSRSLAVGERLV